VGLHCLESAFEIGLNECSGKAVADGTVIWYVRNSVIARATRFAFGTSVMVAYDQDKAEHQSRFVSPTAIGERVNGVCNVCRDMYSRKERRGR
jgi:hypothetical protein